MPDEGNKQEIENSQLDDCCNDNSPDDHTDFPDHLESVSVGGLALN
jgi:hypothetical protein